MDLSLSLESLTNVSTGGRGSLNLVYYTISMMGVYGVIFNLSMDAIFLILPHNLGLVMNIDWFQPFKRTTYSVGVIYLVIMNLPREEHFLPENVIICGIIPGPSEPKRNINHFLLPLVSDLQKLWTSVFMDILKCPLPIFIRAALLCTACDLPATRKCCGFTSHNSTMGCSKCLKVYHQSERKV